MSGESDRANDRAQREVQQNKNLSSSVHLTDSLEQRRPRKQKKAGKAKAGLSNMRVEKNEADVECRYLMPNRRKVKNKCEVTHNVSPHVFPTPSPEETSLNTCYSDVFQLEVVNYLDLSGWVKSVNDYKRFCLLLTESEMENLASVYYTKSLVTHSVRSEKEISISRGKETHFNVKDQQNVLNTESEDTFHACVLSRQQLPLIVDVHCDVSADANTTRHPSEIVSTLTSLPADSFSDDKGKHWSSERVENNIDYQLSIEKYNDFSAELRFCPRSNGGESLVVRSVTVNDFYETCNSTEELASFQENLYSLLRLHTVFESHFPAAKSWWQDIGFLHVYNIAMAGIFFYLVIK